MRFSRWAHIGLAAVLVAGLTAAPASAQGTGGLTIHTTFPAQVVGLGESLTFDLSLRSDTAARTVNLAVVGLPDGWSASFRSGGRPVLSAYVEPGKDVDFDLRVEVPATGTPGDVTFRVRAEGGGAVAELPLTLRVEDRAPARLELTVDLPVLRGKPDTTFRYNVTLNNQGDEDLVVNLDIDAPTFFDVVFKSGSQEITSLPVQGGGSARLTLEAKSIYAGVPAGVYPLLLTARGGEVEASLDLVAEIVGQSKISLTTPDGLLSGRMQSGRETGLTLVVQNSGTAPAAGISLSATPPRDWNIRFDPEILESIPAGGESTVTAYVTPSESALAGDYVITFRAQPETGASASVEYRSTVAASTLWGLVGILLIAVAVGVVGVAVIRFGRR